MIKRDWGMTEKQSRLHKNLMTQVNKYLNYKHHHQGFRGTERYKEGLNNFSKHLAIHYQSQHFKNVSDKHLKSFIAESKKVGVAPATIKTDLAAIRKFHSLYPKTRNTLSDNKGLGYTDKRVQIGVDRAWRTTEVEKAVHLAYQTGRTDVAWSIQLARHGGLRIEEVTALYKTQLKGALEKGYLSLRVTKGGIARDVPLNKEMRKTIQEIVARTERERIFIGHGKAHHQAFKSIQNWMTNHRDKFQETWKEEKGYLTQLQIDLQRPSLTFHGLRHTFARQHFSERLERHLDALEARREVAELLGHGRDEVTRIYLGKGTF